MRTAVLFSVAILAVLLVVPPTIAKKGSAGGDPDLLSELIAKRDDSSSGIVSVNTKAYHRYVLGKRDYHLFVFYTASNSACALCRAAIAPLEAVANTLRKAFPVPDAISIGEDGKPKDGDINGASRLVIIKADYPRCPEIFQAHPSLKGVPHLVYIPPGKAAAVPPEQLMATTKWLPAFNKRNEYSLQSGDVDPTDILSWLHKKTRSPGTPPDLLTDPWPARIKLTLLLCSTLGSLTLVMSLCGARRFCLFFSLFVIMFITGGGMWGLIRGANWVDPSSGDWIVRWNGSQHLMEGVVVAMLAVIGGGAILVINSGKVRGSGKGGAVWTVVCAVVCAWAFYSLRAVYMKKNRSYGIYTS